MSPPRLSSRGSFTLDLFPFDDGFERHPPARDVCGGDDLRRPAGRPRPHARSGGPEHARLLPRRRADEDRAAPRRDREGVRGRGRAGDGDRRRRADLAPVRRVRERQPRFRARLRGHGLRRRAPGFRHGRCGPAAGRAPPGLGTGPARRDRRRLRGLDAHRHVDAAHAGAGAPCVGPAIPPVRRRGHGGPIARPLRGGDGRRVRGHRHLRDGAVGLQVLRPRRGHASHARGKAGLGLGVHGRPDGGAVGRTRLPGRARCARRRVRLLEHGRLGPLRAGAGSSTASGRTG